MLRNFFFVKWVNDACNIGLCILQRTVIVTLSWEDVYFVCVYTYMHSESKKVYKSLLNGFCDVIQNIIILTAPPFLSLAVKNLAEAEYAVALYMYMRLLGYPADRISILTTYNGQKHLIRDVINQRCAGNSFFSQPNKVRTHMTTVNRSKTLQLH